ncbi:GyrI-like domain-containing protein [Paenibacillus sp. PK1-4R]|uniref:GyrI-like domain-containing protein n=1 Tax=Paenibacillus sp. PK1-4R TaxID=3049075 RepID=UPI002055CB57|nr:GyrI-like domain-containing protein [Paenibacillus sp. PK1-4R]UOK65825.1 GyrI-like domain-containing protein [Paenibacillus sp. OVF10]WJM10619.1 GyrI-like domain-containing protein [Paenibacillus sp. PK1-4R]
MEVKVITLPAFHVVGYLIVATVEEFESGLGKSQFHKLVEGKKEIQHRKNDNVILMQMYPMHEDFNAKVDKFTHLIGYEVTSLENVPSEMISHDVPDNQYVTCTHRGIESEIGDTYDYIYGQWLGENGHEPKDYDFEIWDERYQSESVSNEIDIYVALQ